MRYTVEVENIRSSNITKWYKEGTDDLHRIGGPAVECDGDKYWFYNRKYHRLDGPAVHYANGYKEWYIFGKRYSEEAFNKVVIALEILKDNDVEITIRDKNYKLVEVK